MSIPEKGSYSGSYSATRRAHGVGVERAVEVIHDAGKDASPRWRVASGFLVGGPFVVTVAHVAGYGKLTVRLDGRTEHEAILRKRGNTGLGADLAILEITDPAFTERLAMVHFAAIERSASSDIEGCWAVGFPAFEETGRGQSGHRVRDTAHLRGRIPPGAKRISGMLELEVTASPRPLPSSIPRSEWEGISGSVVFAPHRTLGDLALGVIAEHHRAEGSSSLTVVPITAVNDLPDASEWWELLGTDPRHLVLLPYSHQQAPPTYWATVAQLIRRTPVLYGRARELAELSSYARGHEGYRWLISGPWAGKTALAAHLTVNLGSDVDWIAFFLSRREGDADSTSFLAFVTGQLARLLGEEPPLPPGGLHAFRSLWEQAVAEAQRASRHLLLIVDGLDEDLSQAKGLPSVASMLPTLVGSHAHVLVTSRPYPELPGDVDVDHPLRRLQPLTLEPSLHGADLKQRAQQELKAVLMPSGPDADALKDARELLCLLTAAEGPLSVQDLATLSSRQPYAVQLSIDSQVGRAVQRAGMAEAERFVFAHETLREHSEQHFARYGDLDAAREQIIEWAGTWGKHHWPIQQTPRYLLDSYPSMLAAHAPRLLHQLYDDSAYVEAAVAQVDFAYVEAAVAQVGVERTMATLQLASRHNTGDQEMRQLLQILAREPHLLRPPHPVTRPGYVAGQLLLQALSIGAGALAKRARAHIDQLQSPHLRPCWTRSRTGQELASILAGHSGGVTSVAVTPDGSRVVSGSNDATIRIWDLAKGTPVGEPLTGHSGGVTSVAVTPDGSRIVSGGCDSTIRIWDLAKGTSVGEPLTGHGGAVTCLAVTPDGSRIVSGGDDSTVRIWDLARGTSVGEPLTGDSNRVACLAVTPDGSRVISSSSSGISVWDLKRRTRVQGFGDFHNELVTSVAVNPQCTRVICNSGYETVRVWDLATGADVRGDRGFAPAHWGTSVAVTPDGTRIVTGCHDSDVHVSDLEYGSDERVISTGHGGEVTSVAVTPDGSRIVSASNRDPNIRIWDLATGIPAGGEILPPGHTDRVNTVAITPDGTHVVSGDDDSHICAWDLATGARTWGHDLAIRSVPRPLYRLWIELQDPYPELSEPGCSANAA